MSQQNTSQTTAALIVIGNEILSGRTQDSNTEWIADKMTERGIRLVEVRIVPDVEDTIIQTVREMKEKVTYLFTRGGIGPTHDDITALSIAKAFDLPLVLDPDARVLPPVHRGAVAYLN